MAGQSPLLRSSAGIATTSPTVKVTVGVKAPSRVTLGSVTVKRGAVTVSGSVTPGARGSGVKVQLLGLRTAGVGPHFAVASLDDGAQGQDQVHPPRRAQARVPVGARAQDHGHGAGGKHVHAQNRRRKVDRHAPPDARRRGGFGVKSAASGSSRGGGWSYRWWRLRLRLSPLVWLAPTRPWSARPSILAGRERQHRRGESRPALPSVPVYSRLQPVLPVPQAISPFSR